MEGGREGEWGCERGGREVKGREGGETKEEDSDVILVWCVQLGSQGRIISGKPSFWHSAVYFLKSKGFSSLTFPMFPHRGRREMKTPVPLSVGWNTPCFLMIESSSLWYSGGGHLCVG